MQRSLGAPIQAHHVGSLVWVPERNAVDAQGKKKAAGWVKGRVVAEKKNKARETLLDVQTDAGIQTLTPGECPLQNERDDTVDDLVKSDFLHEPGYLLHHLPCLLAEESHRFLNFERGIKEIVSILRWPPLDN